MEPISDLVAEIRARLKPDKVFQVSGPRQATVLLEDDSYRRKTLTGREEFFFKGVRPGKRAIIFEFEPVDASPFKRVEFNDREVVRAVAGFSEWVEEILGMPLERAKREFRRKPVETETALEADKYASNSLWGLF